MPPEEKIKILEEKVNRMELLMSQLFISDKYTIQKDLQLFDGRNIITATGTGTKIGSSTSEKIGFWGKTPVVQQARPTDAGSIIIAGTAIGIWA